MIFIIKYWQTGLTQNYPIDLQAYGTAPVAQVLHRIIHSFCGYCPESKSTCSFGLDHAGIMGIAGRQQPQMHALRALARTGFAKARHHADSAGPSPARPGTRSPPALSALMPPRLGLPLK
jgi:hypothetical protein